VIKGLIKMAMNIIRKILDPKSGKYTIILQARVYCIEEPIGIELNKLF
jgi:hypothetical protein